MIPTMAQFQTKALEILRAQVEWARREYQLPNLNPQLVLWDKITGPEGQASFRTNKLRIKSFYFTRFQVRSFSEYASYAWRPEVGSFTTENWTIALEALIAHEVAHFIHYGFKYTAGHPLKVEGIVSGLGRFDNEPHGDFFQRILLFMRRQFVNSRIDGKLGQTAKGSDFDTEGFFEERLAATPDCPYTGMEFNVGRHQLRMAGYNPNTTKKLFKYQAESRVQPGKFFMVKLRDFINNSKEGKALMESTPALQKEYREHMEAQASKKIASARSSLTKKRRAVYRKMAMAA